MTIAQIFTEISTNIGQLYYNTGRYAESLAYFEKSLVLMKKERFFFERLIQNIFVLKKFLSIPLSDIASWLDELLNDYHVEPILYQLLGLCNCELGLAQKAKKMFELAYSINPSMENLFYLVNIKTSMGVMDSNERKNILEIIKNADKSDKIWVDEIKKRV